MHERRQLPLMHHVRQLSLLMLTVTSLLGTASCSRKGAEGSGRGLTLLNVSYDPTRELYAELNPRYAELWRARTGQQVRVEQSHGGSGKQARSVIEGLQADVVTLALAHDIEAIGTKGHLIDEGWQAEFPHRSSPYTSTIVLVVRKGNPKGIHDFGDLIKDGVQIVTANPKTGGGARWNYLAAWGYALRQPGGTPETAKAFVRSLYSHVLVLDSGARGATTSFAERGLGDVLVTWESEALLAAREFGTQAYEMVVPSTSILAEPPVAIVDRVVDARGTRAAAQAYLEYLFSPEAQEIAAKHGYRPRDPEVLKKHASTFAPVTLFTVDEVFGGWTKAQQEHFADGGTFDQIYRGAP